MIDSQILRYVLVGSIYSLVLYLALTTLGVGYKMAMTGFFVLGVLQTFIFNKRWTFAHAGDIRRSLFRYLIAYGGCYGLNLSILIVFVDHFGISHQIVQGGPLSLWRPCCFCSRNTGYLRTRISQGN